MKQLAKYLLPLCCGIALASCYGLDKEEYRELAPITVSGLDRTCLLYTSPSPRDTR